MTATPNDPGHQAPRRDPGRDTGRPEDDSGAGRRDVTGRMPDNVRVDPDVTEGQPGYQESGDSEIIPDERIQGSAGGRKPASS